MAEAVTDPKISSNTPKPFKDYSNSNRLHLERITRFIKPEPITIIKGTTIRCKFIPISENDVSARMPSEKNVPVDFGFELIPIGNRKLLVATNVVAKTTSHSAIVAKTTSHSAIVAKTTSHSA